MLAARRRGACRPRVTLWNPEQSRRSLLYAKRDHRRGTLRNGTTVTVCRGKEHMPGGGYRTDVTFTGKGCSKPGQSTGGVRPIWVDFLVALLLVEALREAIQVVKGWFRRRRCVARSSEPRRAAHNPPPSEQLLPGEDPADLYGPSAPTQPSVRVLASAARNIAEVGTQAGSSRRPDSYWQDSWQEKV